MTIADIKGADGAAATAATTSAVPTAADAQAPAGTRRPLRGAVGTASTALLVAAAITALLLLWQRSGMPGLEAPDRFFYDLRHVYLAKQPATTLPDLAVVSVTADTIAAYAAEQPVDRALLAKLVQGLGDSGATAIGLDFRFDRPTAPDKDKALAAAIREAKVPVVVGVVDGRSPGNERGLGFQRQFLDMAGSPRVGHLYFDRKRHGLGQPDLAVRFIARRTGETGHVQESFAEALLTAAGKPVTDIGQTRIASAGEVGPHIAWLNPLARDGSRTFTEIDVGPARPGSESFDALIPPSLREAVKGRIVIIGGRFDDIDRHVTPFSVLDGARTTGAEIHAQIAAQLAEGRRLTGLSLVQEAALVGGIALFGFVFGYWRRQSGGLGDYLLLTALLIVAGGLAFSLSAVILPSDTMFYAALISIAVGHQGLRWLSALRRLRLPRM